MVGRWGRRTGSRTVTTLLGSGAKRDNLVRAERDPRAQIGRLTREFPLMECALTADKGVVTMRLTLLGLRS